MNMNKKASAINIKLALIPILGGILYAVLPGDFLSSRSNLPESATGRDANDATKSVTDLPKPKSSMTEKVGSTAKDWPMFSEGNLEGVDPFDRRRVFPEVVPTPIESQASLREGVLVSNVEKAIATRLAPSQIKAIFQSPMGNTALIGDRVVRIGDRLDDGAVVINISPEEVVISPTPSTN